MKFSPKSDKKVPIDPHILTEVYKITEMAHLNPHQPTLVAAVENGSSACETRGKK